MADFRRSHRRRLRTEPADQLQRIAQGEGGERALQDWLDRSRLAYLFLDQTPLTIATAHRADVKRPDFLVAIDRLGMVAVDAKAKAFIDGQFVLDASERRRLDGFESVFDMPVWYACFPPEEPPLCFLFRNRALMGAAVSYDNARHIIRAPVGLGFSFQPASTSFAAALAQADADDRALRVRKLLCS